jgi:CheY-like chemotaxis protein
LRECGYKVVEAFTTDEAVEILSRGAPTIDVTLADARSSGRMDGFGFARWVREQGIRTNVVLAASVEKVIGEAGELCEDGPHLAKPYDHRLLLDRIKRELARGARAKGAEDSRGS